MQVGLREKEQLVSKVNRLEEQLHQLKSEKEKSELKYQQAEN